MKKIITIIFVLTLATQISGPVTVLAVDTTPPLDYSGFVKCDGVIHRDDAGQILESEKKRNKVCDFAALMETVNSAITWLFVISIPVASVMFAYAGLLYMRGTSGTKTKANKIFTSVGIGFIIMLIAWFAVKTIVDRFVKPLWGATTFLGK